MPRLVSSDCICLEPLPKWPGAEGLRPRFVTYAETYKAVHAVAPIAVLDVSDAAFVHVPFEILAPLIKWTQAARVQLGFNYVPNSRDCDKFAKAFTLAFECCAARARIQAQPLCARIYVKATVPWAGVSDGTHALCAVGTTAGIYIVEPQNGRFCKLEDYPNRAGIYKVTIGG